MSIRSVQPSVVVGKCFLAIAVGVLATPGARLQADEAAAIPASAEEQPSREAPAQIAERVDRLLAEETFAGRRDPAPLANDETFLRRVTLDLIGRNPTAAEISAFALDPAEDKRARLIDRLLADSRYGANWAGYWRDVIMYRRSEERATLVVPALTSYLTEQLNANTPWDELARSFVTATGPVVENGATAVIMAQMGQPEETVAELSRIFMGIQIQCAQCHDHHTDRWTREQFHQLAAFFPRVAVRPTEQNNLRSYAVIVNDSSAGFGRPGANRFRGTPEHYMNDLDNPRSRGKLMQPVLFATGQKLPTGTRDEMRRGKLAEWMTAEENPWFARALVNRLWSELVGEGFYEPVDDMGPDRQATAPQTLDALAAAFVASGHDVKHLFRVILSTEAYQRESLSRRLPNHPAFAANTSQRLRGDQLYTNLMAALGGFDSSSRSRGFQGASPLANFRDPRRLFTAVFGYDPSEPREEVVGSIPQTLALMNSPVVHQALSARSNWIDRLLRVEPDDDAAATEVFLRVLARQPTESELQTFRLYRQEVSSRREAYEDLAWALINSAEFLHRR